jgi:hypothetical protein
LILLIKYTIINQGKSKMNPPKIPEQDTKKKLQWIQQIEQQISDYTQGRFTGKLVFILNLSQGGITDGSIQTDSKLNKKELL